MNDSTVEKIKKEPFFTWFFLGAQIIVFFINSVLPEILPRLIPANLLYYYGVMSAPFIVFKLEFWRFFTPMVIHFGFMHLAVNSVVLYFMGSQIEKIYGHSRFLCIYLFSGMLGNMASFAFHSTEVISAGASTSLFGLFGAFVILGIHFKENQYIKEMSKQFGLFILLSFAFGMFDRSIDFWGHIGGLIGGILIGNILCLPRPAPKYSIHTRLLSLIVFVFFVIICVIYGFKKYL